MRGPSEQIFTRPKREKRRCFIEWLKVFGRTLPDKNFDFIGLNTEAEEFCRRHRLGVKTVYNV